jgi:hypothetical protein
LLSGCASVWAGILLADVLAGAANLRMQRHDSNIVHDRSLSDSIQLVRSVQICRCADLVRSLIEGSCAAMGRLDASQ